MTNKKYIFNKKICFSIQWWIIHYTDSPQAHRFQGNLFVTSCIILLQMKLGYSTEDVSTLDGAIAKLDQERWCKNCEGWKAAESFFIHQQYSQHQSCSNFPRIEIFELWIKVRDVDWYDYIIPSLEWYMLY